MRARYGNRMPTRLFLVRHGETEWSRSGRHTSITDLPLTENGKVLARALKGHLSPEDFQLFLRSPRRPARETAELAGFVGAYEPEIDNDLAEWFYGDYEGKTSNEIWKTVPGGRRRLRLPVGSTEWSLGSVSRASIRRSASVTATRSGR